MQVCDVCQVTEVYDHCSCGATLCREHKYDLKNHNSNCYLIKQAKEKKYDDITQFTLTDEHLILLKNMCVDWNDSEFGGAEIDPKRPYGNSDVEDDIRSILKDKKLSDTQCYELHRQTKTALQIFLQNAKLSKGVYTRKDIYGSGDWNKQQSKPEVKHE